MILGCEKNGNILRKKAVHKQMLRSAFHSTYNCGLGTLHGIYQREIEGTF